MEDNEMMISDDEIAVQFKDTNFGTSDHRRLVEQGVLKRLCHYHNGSTLTNILKRLGLVDENNEVTSAGRDFGWNAFGHRGQ
jgi:hypothetical protein